MNLRRLLSLFILTVTLPATTAISGDTNDESRNEIKRALKGYDVMTYYEQKKPMKGDEAYTYEWNGFLWYFSNAESLAKFKTAPEKYAPQYQGCCAGALASGKVVEADPTIFRIKEGKLYLFKNEEMREKWSRDPDKNLAAAERNFIKLFSVNF